MNIAERVIQAFGGQSKTSRALGGTPVSTVDGWRRSGRIPHWRRAEIIAAAERHGVKLPIEFLTSEAA